MWSYEPSMYNSLFPFPEYLQNPLLFYFFPLYKACWSFLHWFLNFLIVSDTFYTVHHVAPYPILWGVIPGHTTPNQICFFTGANSRIVWECYIHRNLEVWSVHLKTLCHASFCHEKLVLKISCSSQPEHNPCYLEYPQLMSLLQWDIWKEASFQVSNLLLDSVVSL